MALGIGSWREGADAYLVKPVEFKELEAVIRGGGRSEAQGCWSSISCSAASFAQGELRSRENGHSVGVPNVRKQANASEH